MNSVQEEKTPTEAPTKTRVQDLRNAELVSRLLAATPPYLYSALPLQPHAFFFSEMLRSFVNARNGCRPPHFHRRFKRRAHKYFAGNEENWQRYHAKDEDKKDVQKPEIPLELTVEKQQKINEERLSPKNEEAKRISPPPNRPASYVDVGTEELAKPAPCLGRNDAVPPLILPPPPPMWYPPIYNPQFGVDPLNFFIDLRVSGHIYDRKRALAEGLQTNANQDLKLDDGDKRLNFSRTRHSSAFSVPVRSGDGQDKYYPFVDNVRGKSGTSYVMKNLKQVYEDVRPIDVKTDDGNAEDGKDSDVIDDDIVD